MTNWQEPVAPAHGCVGERRVVRGSNRPLVLIVTGPPASGKSTLGRQLALRLGLPFLSKDLFKETLFDQLGWSDREWSRRLGGASMALLFRCAAALLEAGQSVALESNFYPAWDTPHLRRLADQFACRFVQVVCTASGPTLVERYQRRSVSGERHPGHTESEPLEETLARLLSERWDALDLEGPVIRVETEREAPDRMVDAIVEDIRAAIRPAGSGCETSAASSSVATETFWTHLSLQAASEIARAVITPAGQPGRSTSVRHGTVFAEPAPGRVRSVWKSGELVFA